MRLLENFIRAKKEVLEAFGCVYNVDTYPLEGFTELYWYWPDDNIWYSSEEDLTDDNMYRLNANPKFAWFYGDYTMIIVDDDNGGDAFLAVFDNNKRLSDELR